MLVTGAGGSIGSELCRQIHRYEPAELMMLDRDESALHAVQLSISGHALLDSDEVVLCDIRDTAALNQIFLQRRPEVVFHAAALKHLPMLEQYPAEAVKTNIHGTRIVLDAAKRAGVEKFVNISTDKAANPCSVLGYSKRIAERITAQRAETADGAFLSVRFGNVLGSRGSVLTSFAKQIAEGGPVTVTDPEVTRFFMTIEEACQLVIQAAAIGNPGEALVLDMGEAVRITDVAQQLIEQSGTPVEIVYTGLRDGEKMHEDLFGDDEPQDLRPTHPMVSHVPVPKVLDAEIDALPVTGTSARHPARDGAAVREPGAAGRVGRPPTRSTTRWLAERGAQAQPISSRASAVVIGRRWASPPIATARSTSCRLDSTGTPRLIVSTSSMPTRRWPPFDRAARATASVVRPMPVAPQDVVSGGSAATPATSASAVPGMPPGTPITKSQCTLPPWGRP